MSTDDTNPRIRYPKLGPLVQSDTLPTASETGYAGAMLGAPLFLPVDDIAPDLRLAFRQPRLLPLPEELQHPKDAVHARLRDELLSLGESLRERQIQPIIVYCGTSELFPAAQYLILAGHRRWTAAKLTGMETIAALVMQQPSPIEVVTLQYEENERRSDFSDMERAWALHRMKELHGTVSWSMIEKRVGLSESRRKQLLRLLTFTPEQQKFIALHRLPETLVRSLIPDVRARTLSEEETTKRLSALALLGSAASKAAGTVRPSRQPQGKPGEEQSSEEVVSLGRQDEASETKSLSTDLAFLRPKLEDALHVCQQSRTAFDQLREQTLPDNEAVSLVSSQLDTLARTISEIIAHLKQN